MTTRFEAPTWKKADKKREDDSLAQMLAVPHLELPVATFQAFANILLTPF